MEAILNFLNSDILKFIILFFNVIMVVMFVINNIRIKKLKKSYNDFLEKVGDGKNFQNTLNNYIGQVNKVVSDINETGRYCEKINHNMMQCIQKVGVIRYNAFKDVGSDLSFALALLDFNNTGVVINGIYTQEHTNIYAKPIIKGSSRYNLSDEEKDAIKKAIYNNDVGKIR